MIKLRLLGYFKAVVEKGSISAASEVLHVAQPPLSKALHQLEEQLNVQLFERSSRGMIPTEAGRYLYQRAGDLLKMATDIEEEMRSFSDGLRGVIRIGTITMGMGCTADMIGSLRTQGLALTFSLHQGDTRHLEELLEHRLIDAALVHLPLSAIRDDLSILPLVRACFRAVCPADSALAESPALTLRMLADHPLALMRRKSGFGVYEKVLQRFAGAELTPNIVADATDVPMLRQLVRQGIAVALMPMLPDQPDNEGLVSIPVPELDSEAAELALIYRTQQAKDAALRPMIDYFTSIRQHP